MSFIIAIANQKGGVGKTTSAVSLAAELALQGRRVLLIDFDPQANATSGLGIELNEEGRDLYDVFFKRIALADILKQTDIANLWVAPASKDLVSVELELGRTPGRELILKSEINLLKTRFDYILIDCPPSSGLLTLNALGAAKHIFIPLQAEYYALEGLTGLLETVKFVNETFNPDLSVVGVFLTMYDSRTNLSAQIEQEVREYFGPEYVDIKVPRNIRLSECPSHGLPICQYAPNSAGAEAYHNLALELINRTERQNIKLASNS